MFDVIGVMVGVMGVMGVIEGIVLCDIGVGSKKEEDGIDSSSSTGVDGDILVNHT